MVKVNGPAAPRRGVGLGLSESDRDCGAVALEVSPTDQTRRRPTPLEPSSVRAVSVLRRDSRRGPGVTGSRYPDGGHASRRRRLALRPKDGFISDTSLLPPSTG